jgi:hypothetical protein
MKWNGKDFKISDFTNTSDGTYTSFYDSSKSNEAIKFTEETSATGQHTYQFCVSNKDDKLLTLSPLSEEYFNLPNNDAGNSALTEIAKPVLFLNFNCLKIITEKVPVEQIKIIGSLNGVEKYQATYTKKMTSLKEGLTTMQKTSSSTDSIKFPSNKFIDNSERSLHKPEEAIFIKNKNESTGLIK